MFNSLKEWLDIPVVIKPYLKRTGTGTKEFGASRSELCYAEGEVKSITNKDGKEIKSMKQLYLDGKVTISELDNVVFEDRESEIVSIGYFYRNGLVDLKVVYL